MPSLYLYANIIIIEAQQEVKMHDTLIYCFLIFYFKYLSRKLLI